MVAGIEKKKFGILLPHFTGSLKRRKLPLLQQQIRLTPFPNEKQRDWQHVTMYLRKKQKAKI
jgi:hypothetical protein